MINEKRLIENFISLVGMDSPSFCERQVADAVKQQLRELGFLVKEDNAGHKINGNCGNVYGFLQGGTDGKPLLFCAHMDTVEPSRGKKAVLEPDGTIHSDGTTVLGADDLGGAAILLEVLRTVKEKGLPHRSLEVLFTVAEEHYCRGAEVFDFSGIQSREAYVLDYDGAVGSAVTAAPTILAFSVEIKGKAAHAGFAPETGIHAIVAAADAVSRIGMGRIDQDTTVNIGIIDGGTAANIIPESCVVQGEIRSYMHETAEKEWRRIQGVFTVSAAQAGASVQFKERYGCRAYETPPESPVVRRFETACSSLGITPVLTRTFGGSDNNVLAYHGITGIVVASAMHKCHTCGEYTSSDELALAANLVLQVILSEKEDGKK